MSPTIFLATLAVFAGGERGGVRELHELRKTVEDLKADLSRAREQEAVHQRALELRLAEAEPVEAEYVAPPIEARQARWRAYPARITKPREKALARSIAEEEWEFLRKMGDRQVEDYGS